MTNFERHICLGFSPTMLFPEAFDDPLAHFDALMSCCRYPFFETFETYLPEEKAMRSAVIREMHIREKNLNYNVPGILQVEGSLYPCSDDPCVRKRALEYTKKHAEYGAECDCRLFIMTACADQGPQKRQELLKRYYEYFLESALYAKSLGMEVAIEPIERHRFKKLILGPTKEVCKFVIQAQKDGADNVRLMLDIAHLPLMGETLEEAIQDSLGAGLTHIHMGDAVLDPGSRFYGHTHPPLNVHGSEYNFDTFVQQFLLLFKYDIVPKIAGKRRGSISIECRPYPGVSEAVSIQTMYEIVKSACDKAAEQLGIY